MKLLLKLVISAISIIIIAKFLPGVSLAPPYTNALIVAAVLALLNSLLRPILIILTLPITIVTLGLFLLIINASIILLADELISGFGVRSFWTALLFSLLLSLLQSVFNTLFKEDKSEEEYE